MLKLCERCERERVHYAKGLCHSCYVMLQFKKNPKSKDRAVMDRLKNKTYYKNYYLKYYAANKERLLQYQKDYHKKKRELKEHGV